MTINRNKGANAEPLFTIEESRDPAALAQAQRQAERGQRNDAWLQAHWADLLPQARGRFLAVAGEEGFVANTPEEAWGWVKRTHPEDDGAFVQYVLPHPGPRIYAYRR